MPQLVDTDTVLRRIKETVHRLVPDAAVILYGSRARGDAQPDSDWDVLVLTEEEVTRPEIEAIADALYDVELDTGTVIVPIVRSRAEWDAPLRKATPFYKNVTREGVPL